MSAKKHAHGFTLIELLVVISILALLIAVLLPALTKAKQIAVRAVCQANYKNMGRLIHTFVNTHGGRGPSDCWGIDYANMHRGRSWVGAINVEVLGQKHYWETTAGFIQGMGPKAVKGFLYCPSEYFYGSLYPRAQELNINVSGGDSVGEMYDRYGIKVASPPSNPLPDDMITSGKWEVYGLGPMIERFTRPGFQYLVVETEAGWEYWSARDDGPVVLGKSTLTTPAWEDSGNQDMLAFRHTLPRDVNLYQQSATACVLYIDGHVEIINANGHINYQDRSNLY